MPRNSQGRMLQPTTADTSTLGLNPDCEENFSCNKRCNLRYLGEKILKEPLGRMRDRSAQCTHEVQDMSIKPRICPGSALHAACLQSTQPLYRQSLELQPPAKPVAPVGPVPPVPPVSPPLPVSPFIPVSPVAPVSPFNPVSP